MAISILNNIPALAAENQLSMTQANLNQTLEQLASGSRINTGADDAAVECELVLLHHRLLVGPDARGGLVSHTGSHPP